MSWLSLAAPFIGGITSLLGATSSRRSAGAAASQAEALSAQQRAILEQALRWAQQYGEPMLAQEWQKLQHPEYGDAFENALVERQRADIERAYRPGYGAMLSRLSQRGMLTSPNSTLGRETFAMDRARADKLAQLYTERMASKKQEQTEALARFADLLSQLRGGSIGLASAYSEPISAFGNLAAQGYQGYGDSLAELIKLLMGQKASA